MKSELEVWPVARVKISSPRQSRLLRRSAGRPGCPVRGLAAEARHGCPAAESESESARRARAASPAPIIMIRVRLPGRSGEPECIVDIMIAAKS
jgi:hypothetical protein